MSVGGLIKKLEESLSEIKQREEYLEESKAKHIHIKQSVTDYFDKLFGEYIAPANENLPPELRITKWKSSWTNRTDYDLLVNLVKTGGKEQDEYLFEELREKDILNEEIGIHVIWGFNIPSYLKATVNKFEQDIKSRFGLRVRVRYADWTSSHDKAKYGEIK